VAGDLQRKKLKGKTIGIKIKLVGVRVSSFEYKYAAKPVREKMPIPQSLELPFG
jgi:hypothetical protein